MNKKDNEFPKDFFDRKIPDVTNEETFKDITPINWNENMKGNVIVFSAKEITKNDILKNK